MVYIASPSDNACLVNYICAVNMINVWKELVFIRGFQSQYENNFDGFLLASLLLLYNGFIRPVHRLLKCGEGLLGHHENIPI